MDMATDIVPELNEAIQSTFQTRMVSDKRIMRINRRIRDGTATLVDAHRYSQYTGENLSKALLQNLRADTLPGGTLYYNIANRTVTPALRNNYNLVNEISKQVQAIADKVTEIGITAVAADFPEERIKGLIDKMTSYDNLEESLAWLKEPIVNNTEAFFDDYVQSNAAFRRDVGLETVITRTAEPNCCEWCANLEGEWYYGEEPKEIYQRHEFCRCDVTYKSKRGYNQNVWSKEIWKPSAEELKARRESQMPTMSASERQALINQTIRR